MSWNFKKRMLKQYTYIPKNIIKHKHNYSIKCVLEITNKNVHASALGYNTKEYYNVFKCDTCNSFKEDSKERYISKNEEINTSIPLIKGNTNYKNPAYHFCDLFDVVVDVIKEEEGGFYYEKE